MPAAGRRTRRRRGRRNATAQAWLAVAAVAVAGATIYLAMSIAGAVDDDAPPAAVPLSTPDAIATQAKNDDVPVPPSAEASASETVTPAPPPIPGLAPAVGDPALVEAMEEGLGEDRDRVAVSVMRISDSRAASINGEHQWYAASTFKLAILYEAELRHFRGELEYDDTIFISDEDAAEDLGTSDYLEFEEDGSIRIDRLLEAMITVSDNSSAVALLHEFGSGNIDLTLRELGLEKMTVSQLELWTTADDLARLMAAIYVGEGVGAEERDHMRSLLLRQTIRSGIPAALEDELDAGVRIGNKTGTWPGAQHDVAFVEAQEGAYVIAVLTDGSYEAWLALHRVVPAVQRALAETS